MPSPFLYPPPDIRQPVIIREDGGGEVTQYMAKAFEYKIEGRRVEIRGSCRSACLLALSVPKVCVTEGAVVKAHHAYESATGSLRPDVTNKMLAELPSNIRQELDGKIQRNYTADSTLTYDELRKLNVPDCNSTKSVRASDPPKAEKPRKITYRMATPIDGLLNLFPFLRRK